jgi:hypothetical protein
LFGEADGPRPLFDGTEDFIWLGDGYGRDVVDCQPDLKGVHYYRVSGRKQRGRYGGKLHENNLRALDLIGNLAPNLDIVRGVPCVEKGKLSAKRPGLVVATEEVNELAAAYGRACLVGQDWTRFLRPEAYDPKTNPNVRYTIEEYRQFRDRLDPRVIVAVGLNPDLTEWDRQRQITKLAKHNGRPSLHETMDMVKVYQIFCRLGGRMGLGGPWEVSIAEVARQCGVTKKVVQNLLDGLVPLGLDGFDAGCRWRESSCPGVTYRKTFEKRLLPGLKADD